MPTSDLLGNWEELGTLEPSWEDWLLFPNSILNSETLRISFECQWDKRLFWQSYALFRFYYPVADDVIVSPIFKVWPQSEKTLLTFPIPSELKENNVLLRDLGVKKVYRRGFFNPNYDPTWTVKVEFLT